VFAVAAMGTAFVGLVQIVMAVVRRLD
jgi:hypothetical protein